ncbi:MAG TPA: tetratricopeptide repeat protein [Candidatus Saccharimonadaceae bacterium]|jgi:hypothetical protein|nr:tetratricopeptide repeat protein [Candidatus Saccharimonadaceae bacterium]
MLKRIVIYGALAIAAAAAFLWLRPHGESAPTLAAPAPLDAPVADDGPIRLAPDRRLLLAVGEVDRLTHGHATHAIARFERGAWRVSVASDVVGTLPEYPTFEDGLDLAARHAASALAATPTDSAAAHPEIDQALAADRPLRALLAADRDWKAGRRDAALHAGAAHALVHLAAETNDLVGIADGIAARALAELAVCRALHVTGLERDEALLAARLGYGAEASTIAGALPDGDPVRHYVLHDDARLARLASGPGASAEARSLELRRLAENGDDLGYESFATRYFMSDSTLSLPAMAAGLSLAAFDAQMPSAMAVLLTIEYDLRVYWPPTPIAAMSNGGDLAWAFEAFERTMSGVSSAADGQWLDHDLVVAYYRAAFYSAMWRVGEFSREELSSLPSTRRLAEAWNQLPPGPAQEFGRWYGHLAAQKAGHPAPLDFKADLMAPSAFGSLLRFTTFDACAETPIGRQRGVRAQARLLLDDVDGRPGNRLSIVAVLRDERHDLVDAESLLAVAARTASPAETDARGWWARLDGDRATLLTLLDAPGLPAAKAKWLLASLEEVAAGDEAAVYAAYDRARARFPESCDLMLAEARYGKEHNRTPATNRAMLQAWLARHPDEHGLDRVFVQTAVARTYEREQRYREALAAVLPAAASGQYGAMAVTAEMLDRCGKAAEAEKLAAEALRRYPDSRDALVGLAVLFWRHGRDDDAATLLRDTAYRLDDGNWMATVGPRFADCFAGDSAGAMKAVDALVKAGYNGHSTLGSLALAVRRHAHPALAFEIEQRVIAGGQDGAERWMTCHAFLSAAHGTDAADEWLQARLSGASDPMIGLLSAFAFGESQNRILWMCAPKDSISNSFQWVMRACAALDDTAPDPEHVAALRAHYAAKGTEYNYVLGRYLLGLEPEDTVLALRTTARRTCEVDFYVGYHARAEGRYADAARWFERSLASGEQRAFEYAWADVQLMHWAGRNQTLARMAEVDRASHTGPYLSTLGVLAMAGPAD